MSMKPSRYRLVVRMYADSKSYLDEYLGDAFHYGVRVKIFSDRWEGHPEPEEKP